MSRIQSLRPAAAEVGRGSLDAQTEHEEQSVHAHLQRVRSELQFPLGKSVKILCEA